MDEEAIKVLTGSIERRQKQVDLIESLSANDQLRTEYVNAQRAVIASLTRTLERLKAADTEEPDFGGFNGL